MKFVKTDRKSESKKKRTIELENFLQEFLDSGFEQAVVYDDDDYYSSHASMETTLRQFVKHSRFNNKVKVTSREKDLLLERI